MHLSIEIGKIDRSFSEMRLTRPEQIAWMQNSLKAVGQLHPVVVRKKKDVYQMLDGFKRYYACQALKWKKLQAHVVEVDNVTAKAMILSYNQQGSSLLDYEEAQIVYSLKKEHLMKQEEIATLLSKSYSWVSRRLSFIERLDDSVRTHLQLGKITPTHARELVKLPCGKQNDFLKLIIDNNLTSRQTAILITKYLQSKTKKEQAYLLECPLEAIEQQNMEEEINDCRLSLHGNRLLKTTRILARQQHIFIGHTTNPPLNELTDIELGILAESFTDIVRKIKTIRSILKKYDDHER
ncbi:MAG: ParB/RepB/Spo0J family partition protein [Desulfobacterales bacterium]|nr:ParB/RepB/Spo0J family partition protein [Desulfobacterales bacterium]